MRPWNRWPMWIDSLHVDRWRGKTFPCSHRRKKHYSYFRWKTTTQFHYISGSKREHVFKRIRQALNVCSFPLQPLDGSTPNSNFFELVSKDWLHHFDGKVTINAKIYVVSIAAKTCFYYHGLQYWLSLILFFQWFIMLGGLTNFQFLLSMSCAVKCQVWL